MKTKTLKQKLNKYLNESSPKQLRAELKKRKHLQEIKDEKLIQTEYLVGHHSEMFGQLVESIGKFGIYVYPDFKIGNAYLVSNQKLSKKQISELCDREWE